MGAYNLHITRRRESARPCKRHSAPRTSSEERFLVGPVCLVGLVGPVGLVEPKARASLSRGWAGGEAGSS